MVEDSPKRGLGRGLDALFGDDYAPDPAAPAAARASRTVPIEQLVPGPFQPRRRFDDEALAQLAESIARHGLLQPILVRSDPRLPDRFQIVAGERRWRAAQRARLHEVPVVVREMDDRASLEVALIENIQRQDLSPLEEAEGYRRLIEEFRHTQEELAKSVGRSRSHVANMMRLLALPEPVKRMVDDGRLSAGHARALLSIDDPVGIAEQVVSRGLSVRDIEHLGRAPRKPAKAPLPLDANAQQLENMLRDRLGLTVQLKPDRTGGGTLTVAYSTLDQLDDLVARLAGA
ncbi:MAG: ParB/RepB/Spo0J family partition protein [Alphaproteobacteria bacterium]